MTEKTQPDAMPLKSDIDFMNIHDLSKKN